MATSQHQDASMELAQELSNSSRARLSRPKAQLSCDLCRKKKIKCDRERPCRNCSKLPVGSCVYPRATLIADGRSKKLASNTDSRLDRLERLLTSMASTQNAARSLDQEQDTAETGQVLDSPPKLRNIENSPRYLKGSHWEMVLDEIADINDELLTAQQDQDPRVDQSLPCLLGNDRSNVSISELVCSLPCRRSVEAMIDICSADASLATILVVVHVPTFMEECVLFWQNPDAASLQWLAKLYAIMALAVQAALRRDLIIPDIILTEATAQLYTLRAADCLIKSDYTRPKHGTIEAMSLYLASEHYWNVNNHFGARMVFTLITQLAYRLGYHRDPGHYSGMTTFEREMRRRVWAFHSQMDLLLSEKSGLPRTIDERQADTLDPANLLDQDLDRAIKVLPQERPESEPTTISYLNYKNRSLGIQSKITDRVNSPVQLQYAAILELDQELSAVSERKPAWLQAIAQLESHDAAHIHICRAIEIELISSRTRIVLHRNYLIPGRTQACYAYSRRMCLEAARKILHHQIALSSENATVISPEAGDWRFVSLMSHDFLLGGMVICLDIDQDLRSDNAESPLPRSAENLERSEKIELLYATHRAWSIFKTTSNAGQRGAALIASMVARIQRRMGIANQAASQTAGQDSQPPPHPSSTELVAQPLQLESLPGRVSSGQSNESYPDFGRDVELTMNEILQTPYQIDPNTGEFPSGGMLYSTTQNGELGFDWMSWDTQGVAPFFNLQ